MKAWSSLVNGDWVVTSGSLWGVRVGSGVHLISQQSSQQWSATITNLLTYHHILSTAMNLKKNQIPKLFLSKLIWHPSPKSHKTSQFQIKVKTTVDLIVEIGNCTMHVLMLNVKKRFEIMSKVRKLYKIFLLSRYILKKNPSCYNSVSFMTGSQGELLLSFLPISAFCPLSSYPPTDTCLLCQETVLYTYPLRFL